MQADPHKVTRDLEKALAEYAGAPMCVVTTSCTMALLLCCAWARHRLGRTPLFSIPRRTYVGVGMSIVNARCGIDFHDEDWVGEYELRQLPPSWFSIWDAARRFHKDMFNQGMFGGKIHMRISGLPRFQCVSFHASKILNCGSQGGAIFHNCPEADPILRRMRFDGRTEGVAPSADTFDIIGQHAYLSPSESAALLWKLAVLPDHNPDLPNSDYSDLSLAPIFSGKTPA